MDDKTKGINILPEKEKIKYCSSERNPKLDFWIFVSILLAAVTVFCVGMKTSMIGPSMEPSLYNGQEIFLNRLIYKVASPREEMSLYFFQMVMRSLIIM